MNDGISASMIPQCVEGLLSNFGGFGGSEFIPTRSVALFHPRCHSGPVSSSRTCRVLFVQKLTLSWVVTNTNKADFTEFT